MMVQNNGLVAVTRIGKKAEADFTSLCMDVDAAVNASDDDQHGWDHVVEIVPAKTSNLPADLTTHVISCFAQIKGTKGRRRTATLKLSNAVKSAKSPLPSFVFLLAYTETGVPPTIYACHIWKDQIHHWLKRARETEETGRTDLHRLTVNIKFEKADRLDINPATWIEQTLAPFGDSYTSQKQELVKTVGYNGVVGRATFNTGPDISVGDIVAHEIGLTKSLSVYSFKMLDVRFDITSKQPIHESAKGRVEFISNGREVVLQLKSTTGESFDISALGYMPATVDYEHPEFRIRIAAGHIDIVGSPHQTHQALDLNFDMDKEKTLEEHIGLLKLLCWSQQGPVLYQVLTDQGELFGGSIKDISAPDPWMKTLECSSSHLAALIGEQKCREICITLRDLWHSTHSMYFTAIVHRAQYFRFEGDFETPTPSFEKLAGYIVLSIGDWSIGVIYEYALVEQADQDGRVTYSFRAPTIINKSVFKMDLEAMRGRIITDYEDYKRQSNVPVAQFGNGDLGAWSEQMHSNAPIYITVN